MKSKFKQWGRNLLTYLEHNQGQILKNLLLFAAIVVVMVLTDLLTKQFLFQWKDGSDYAGLHQLGGEPYYQNWFFGIRSVSNSGLTSFGNALPTGVIHFFNFIILGACLGFLGFINSKVLIVAIALIFAGTLGNMVDRFAFAGHVRDIIFLPWADRGTFNLADVEAVSGSFAAVLGLVTHLIKHLVQNK